MKRLGGIWGDVVDKDNGVHAIIDGTRFKRHQRAVQFLLYSDEDVAKDPNLWHQIDPNRAEPYAEQLADGLKTHTWHHRPPRYKRQHCRNRASSKGKWRDLYIPTLADHIVAHMVMSASIKAFTRGMHPHCCGSVPDRGIAHVNRTVKRWMQSDRACRYFVKLDIRHFFDNIDRDKLLEVLGKKIKDKDVMWVMQEIIDSAPIPCPVGYYTSPWFANLYLEDLDWFVEQQLYKERRGKRIKYVRHYLRYVDDILLIGTSRNDLGKAIRAIQDFLRTERCGLEIKPTWEIKAIGRHELVDGEWRLKQGTYWCDIGGYKFCKDSTILRDGIFLASRRLAKDMSKGEYYTYHQSCSINSRIGWASHCDSKNFFKYDIDPYVDLKTTRRVVSDVGKSRKQRQSYPGGSGAVGELYDRQAWVSVDHGNSRDPGALRV